MDERIACTKGGDLTLVVGHTHDVVSHFGKTHRCNKANIAGANNRNLIRCLHIS